MLVFRAEIYKIANREDPDQSASSALFAYAILADNFLEILERAGCFDLTVFLMPCDSQCSVASSQ